MALGTLLHLFSLSSSLLFFSSQVAAETYPIYATKRSSNTDVNLFRRQHVDENGSFGNGSIIVYNTADDLQYSVNITLGGKEYSVLIDTGSSDLYVFGEPEHTKNTSMTAAFAYGKGAVGGYINTADLFFNSFHVPDQAYLLVEKAVDVSTTEGTGLIGFGPSASSTIRRTFNSSAGNPVLDRIFRQNMTTPNYITFLLSRSGSVSDVELLEHQQGVMTIGDIVPEYEHIVEMPKLNALVDAYGSQHWQGLLDSNGIIGPDGKKIETRTMIEQPREGKDDQLHVLFDTGFSLPQLPAFVIDSIYGRIPDSIFIENGSDYVGFDGLSNFWVIPCDYELNVTFMFGGHEYPISPLDMSWEIPDGTGDIYCINYFQQTADNIAGNKGFGALDGILGMAFLRNTYMLIDFGDFVDGSDETVADPYFQILSTIDKAAVHKDFVNARLGGIDITGSQPALLDISNVTRLGEVDKASMKNLAMSDSSKSGEKEDDDMPIYKKAWFIIVIAVAGAALLAIITVIVFTALRRRKSKVRGEQGFIPPMGAYKPLMETGHGPYSDTAYVPKPAHENGRYS
ncbi:aspartic peptidase a1 [Moniliophthora roreri MCA 2997]|uniref:Aspartic peptidase a1 n=1 Tax=Moniliophthora roreri (strain MCA 2997) TaxID=1381753 RepID=V2WXC0_MONRO|nr:aspartic peptidase a1 [Moniliophthora roreri MCA 2997]